MAQLRTERHGRVSILTLSRKDHGNRISEQMAKEIAASLEEARSDPAIAGCVLTGDGDVFCLGGDYQGAGPTTAGRMEFARAFSDMNHAMAGLGKPLVAAVNGNAHAGGFSVVTACDLAFVAEDATLGLPEAAKGLFPFLALAVVKDALPKKVLFDIVYNARLMDAAEALGLHLVNGVVPRGDVMRTAVEAVEKASRINPDVLMLGRDLYYGMRGVGPVESLQQSRFALGAALFASDEQRRKT